MDSPRHSSRFEHSVGVIAHSGPVIRLKTSLRSEPLGVGNSAPIKSVHPGDHVLVIAPPQSPLFISRNFWAVASIREYWITNREPALLKADPTSSYGVLPGALWAAVNQRDERQLLDWPSYPAVSEERSLSSLSGDWSCKILGRSARTGSRIFK